MRKNYTLLLLMAMFITGIANAQIVQVTDINTAANSSVGDPFLYNGEIYFEADDGSAIGDELYRINADSTVSLFMDINTDIEDTSPNSDPGNFIVYKGLLYFNANDGDKTGHGKELWVSDGSIENTKLVYDIYAGDGNGSNPQQFFVFNDNLYFQAKEGMSIQWWKYDGISDPVKVSDLRSGGFAVPSYPVVDDINNRVFFQAITDDGKMELHVMDSEENISILDINPNSHGYTGSEAVLFNGSLIFQGDNDVEGDELWISDGTIAGTGMIKDIFAGADDSNPEGFVEYNGKLYFAAETATGVNLWVTDGTAAGTEMVAEPFSGGDSDVSDLFVYNDKLYFAATDGTNGAELWVYDGTEAKMLRDINETAATGSSPAGFIEVDGLLLFEADNGTGTKLWVSDGTAENTLPVASLFNYTEDPLAVNSGEFVVSGSMLFFTADDAAGDDIFVVDVHDLIAKASQVTDINATGNSGIRNPYVYNDVIYFEADNGDNTTGDELYTLSPDGAAALFMDINTDIDDTSPNSDPGNFIEYKGLLYFNANDGDNTAHDKELWVTDGTVENTKMVYDIYAGTTNGSNPQQLFVFNDLLYFQANDGASTQWWRYDGTNDPVKITELNGGGFGTPMFPLIDEVNNRVFFQANNPKPQLHVMSSDETITVIDINPGGFGYTGSEAIIFNGSLIFQGDNGVDGDELWISDGTVAGTSMITDIFAGADDSNPEGFTEYDGKIYFAAETATGVNLWVTDGTAAGTSMVAEPFSGGDSDVEELFVYNGKLYFSATDGTNGSELWAFDGTNAEMVKDINETAATGSYPAGFTVVDGLMFFEADNGAGTILMVSDGTSEKTMPVAEALNSAVNPTGVDADEFVSIGTYLYYTADDAQGDEFFMVDAKTLFSYDVFFNVSDLEGAIEGAEITFYGNSLTTDVEGKASFEYVRGTELQYSVKKDGYYEETGAVDVTSLKEVDVVLTPLPFFDVTFTVTDGTNPLEGAEINMNGSVATTDASGVAIFADLEAAGDLAYTITLDGYEDLSGTVNIVDADVNADAVLILKTFAVTFNVSDGTTNVDGATIIFNDETMTTDTQGQAGFENVAPATGLEYTISADGYEDATGTVDVVDENVVVNVEMAPLLFSITFVVTDGTNPLEGATITFNDQTLTSDANGEAVFSGIEAGQELSYSVNLDQYQQETGTVNVQADANVDVTLISTGILENMLLEMTVYPNPATDYLRFEGQVNQATYKIYDVNQKVVSTGRIDGSMIEINLESGMYFLHIQNEGKQAIRKIVVQ